MAEGRAVDVFLSVMLIILASVFLTAGGLKLTQSKEKLVVNMPWMEEFSPGALKIIGIAEVLGALGLFLPEVTDTALVVTPLAAVGVAIIMFGASALHVRRGERFEAGITVVMFVVALTVAWGRFGPYSH